LEVIKNGEIYTSEEADIMMKEKLSKFSAIIRNLMIRVWFANFYLPWSQRNLSIYQKNQIFFGI